MGGSHSLPWPKQTSPGARGAAPRARCCFQLSAGQHTKEQGLPLHPAPFVVPTHGGCPSPPPGIHSLLGRVERRCILAAYALARIEGGSRDRACFSTPRRKESPPSSTSSLPQPPSHSHPMGKGRGGAGGKPAGLCWALGATRVGRLETIQFSRRSSQGHE